MTTHDNRPDEPTGRRAITAPQLFDGSSWKFQHAVVIQGDTIVDVKPLDELTPGIPITDLGTGVIAPGFIDLQVNGGGGALFNNEPTVSALQTMVSAHRATGTTAMMPTLISDEKEVYLAGVAAALDAMSSGNPSVLGLHIEGPFLSQQKRGTHSNDMIRQMTDEDLNWLATSAASLPLILTLAPEHCRAGQIELLTKAGIMVCAGHSKATAQQTKAALNEGLRGFTHLFNAMEPLSAREPGVLGTALDDRESWAGIIADGHHVDPVNLSLAHRTKAPGKLCLVTDAMATVGTQQKSFSLYNETVTEDNGVLINAEGKLAGSAIGMIQAVAVAHRSAGIELGECLNMASRYPAEFLNRHKELGQLGAGFRADIVHFDDNFKVHNTWVAGSPIAHSV
ncbi:MAG: N-acetylglucosamine-6-phosphate deacetylase [Halioglobus sp.]